MKKTNDRLLWIIVPARIKSRIFFRWSVIRRKEFSVVAEEVRNRAARSAKSAQETAAMIERIIQQVEHSKQVASEMAESQKSAT